MKKIVDYYKVLGVDMYATQKEIRKAYLKLVQKYHPDKHAGEKLTEEEYKKLEDKIKKINEAYEVLKDENKRYNFDQEKKEYDEQLRREKIRQEYRRQQEEYERQYYYQREQQDEYDREQKKYYREDSKESFWDYIKNSYAEIREEERKYPFSERHARLTKYFNEEHICRDKDFVLMTKFGAIHVAGEFLYQIYKFSKIKEDTLPKYIIRNRKALATIALASVLVTSGGKTFKTTSSQYYDTNNGTSTECKQEEHTVVLNNININNEIVLTRNYIVKAGDTLSTIAENARTSMDKIKSINGIKSENMIYINEEIKVPYTIPVDDLQYYVKSVEIEDISLSDLAFKYQTTEDSIYKLNKDAIEKVNDKAYVVLSDKLLVPTFPTLEEVKKLKNSNNYSR